MRISIIITAVFFLVFNTASAQQSNQVLFKGKVDKRFNDTKVYLNNNITGEKDTAIVKNGEFQFVCPFAIPTRYLFSSEAERRKHGGYRPFGILVQEPSTIEIEGDLESFVSSKVMGSAAQEILNNFSELKSKTEKGKEGRILEKIILENPNSISSAFLLSRNSNSLQPEKAFALYQKLSTTNKESYYGRLAYGQVKGALESEIGGNVKNFVLLKDDGTEFAFESLRGSYVLIDFWASWCGPCIEEFKTLRKLFNKYEGRKPFKILGISTDKDEKAWRRALGNENLPWTQVHDYEGDKSVAVNQFAVKVLPTTYLIDPEGKIIAKDLRGEDLVKKLIELFN